MHVRTHLLAFVAAWFLASWSIAADRQAPTHQQAATALERATQFFRREVAKHGGYVWKYSDDLTRREGEAKVGDTTAWVQPPGTPSIGEAYLAAYRGTGDKQYLEAARETALALVQGQLQSGGWDYRIEFTQAERNRYAYRVGGGSGKDLRNTTTLDDNTTQSAIRLLMHVDTVLKQQDAAIHEAVEFALNGLIKAQYPNGAWPQRFDGPPAADKFPVLKAAYPETWSRTFPAEKYANYYTFNDNALADCIEVMFEAARLYERPAYRGAAERAGGFILLAQLPEPQPVWAQQYNAQMQPAWARKFEPPSVTGGESQGVMKILLRLYQETGDKKYLEPIPRACRYLQASHLSDGRLARFYELRTNKPLFFTKQYELTYSDSDLPTHYGFKISDGTESILKEYERLSKLPREQLQPKYKPADEVVKRSKSGPSSSQIQQAKATIDALDDRGRWVEDGKLSHHGDDDPTKRVIDSRTFVKNVQVLSSYLAATKEQ